MTLVRRTHNDCSSNRIDGTFDNHRSNKREALKKLVLSRRQHHQMDPELCEAFTEKYIRHRNEIRIPEKGETQGEIKLNPVHEHQTPQINRFFRISGRT